MKKYIFLGFVILTLLAVIFRQAEHIKVVKEERESYRRSTYTLLGEIEHYQTKDSLNAVSIDRLELKLSEASKYRSDDMKLIESLKIDKKRLEQITTAQTKTIYELNGQFRDSIVYIDNSNPDTLYCIDISEKWFDLNGCIDANSKSAYENNRSGIYKHTTIS
jgi:hypothetical protein